MFAGVRQWWSGGCEDCGRGVSGGGEGGQIRWDVLICWCGEEAMDNILLGIWAEPWQFIWMRGCGWGRLRDVTGVLRLEVGCVGFVLWGCRWGGGGGGRVTCTQWDYKSWGSM